MLYESVIIIIIINNESVIMTIKSMNNFLGHPVEERFSKTEKVGKSFSLFRARLSLQHM